MKKNIFNVIIYYVLLLVSIENLTATDWQVVYEKQNMFFNNIKCADSLNCFAIANSFKYPFIFNSTDGGNNWQIDFQFQVDYIHYHPIVNDIAFPIKNLCMFVCDSGTVFRSTDGGTMWESNIISANQNLIAIKLLDSLSGLIISSRKIFVSSNAGYDWQELINNPISIVPEKDGHYLQAMILSPNHFLIKAVTSIKNEQYKVFITEDAGSTWSSYDFPKNCEGNWFFSDSLHGWSVGGTPIIGVNNTRTTDKIIKTTDGGKTWLTVVDDTICQPYYPLQDIAFNRQNKGIAVGTYGKILRTINSGNKWSPEYVNFIQINFPFNMNICFAGENTILLTSQSGQIFRNSNVSGYTFINFEPQSNFEIIPNPANDIIKIKSQKIIEKIEIYSTLGIKLLEKVNVESVDISSLPVGFYFLKVNDVIYKFVKI